MSKKPVSENPTPPQSPINLVAAVTSTGSIKLAWKDNSVRENGYRIERGTSATTFSQIAVVGQNVASYTDKQVKAGQKYWYRVRAYNAYGNSTYTNVVSVTTPAPTTPIPSPTPPPTQPPEPQPVPPITIGSDTFLVGPNQKLKTAADVLKLLHDGCTVLFERNATHKPSVTLPFKQNMTCGAMPGTGECTIDITGRGDWSTAFSIGPGIRNATIQDFTASLGSKTPFVSLIQAIDATIRRIAIPNGCGLATDCKSVDGLTVEDITAGVLDRNLMFCGYYGGDATLYSNGGYNQRFRLRRISLVGSINEHGIRIHRGRDIIIEDCPSLNRPNRVYHNNPTTYKDGAALALKDVHDVVIRNVVITGNIGLGPIADGDGGINETDPKKKAALAALRATNVLLEKFNIKGNVDLEAGLSGLVVQDGTISAGTCFSAQDVYIGRPIPQGIIQRVAASGTNFITGAHANIKTSSLGNTLNGKPV